MWCSAMLMVALAAADPGDALTRRCGLESPRPRTADTHRIASWNVLNLFDHADDPALEGKWDDLAMATSSGRCAALAEIIRRVDADVLALQEVESEACLRWFRDTWLADMGYDHIVSLDAGYHRGVECSLLSRWPVVASSIDHGVVVEDTTCGPGPATKPPDDLTEPMPFRRPPLKVCLEDPQGRRLWMLIIHHKAGRGTENAWRREAEACSVLSMLSRETVDGPSLEPDARVMLVGDFNASPGDRSVRAYLEAGLVDVQAHRAALGAEDRPEWATHESGRVIDYILVTPELATEVIPGSTHVVGVPSPPRTWDWRHDPRPDGAPSDHMPLIVDLRVAGQPSSDSSR